MRKMRQGMIDWRELSLEQGLLYDVDGGTKCKLMQAVPIRPDGYDNIGTVVVNVEEDGRIQHNLDIINLLFFRAREWLIAGYLPVSKPDKGRQEVQYYADLKYPIKN